MKGIILAGGTGSRLYPLTKVVNKQLLPIHDKPMIFYPISVLMLADIREILIISSPKDIDSFKKLLGSGAQYGCTFTYEIQNEPNGLAEAFIIGEKFIGSEKVVLMLGDNIIYGAGLGASIREAIKNNKPTIFAYHVENPAQFGVVEFNSKMQVLNLHEKPKTFISSYAIPGLYIYDNTVVSKAKNLKPSSRGEIEITDLNKLYLNENNLNVQILPRGIAWLDTGTPKNLQQASMFVSIVEKNTSKKIACLEEIAFLKNWITERTIEQSIQSNGDCEYNKYLVKLINSPQCE